MQLVIPFRMKSRRLSGFDLFVCYDLICRIGKSSNDKNEYEILPVTDRKANKQSDGYKYNDNRRIRISPGFVRARRIGLCTTKLNVSCKSKSHHNNHHKRCKSK